MAKQLMNGMQVAALAELQHILEAYNLGTRLFRFQIFNFLNLPNWREIVDEQVDRFISMHPAFPKDTIFVLDLHNTPNNGSIDDIAVRAAVINFWIDTTQKIRHLTNVYYGVLNEPIGTIAGSNLLMKQARDAIRNVEKTNGIKNKIISVTVPGGNCTFMNKIVTFRDNLVWYEFHFYSPMQFTGQQIPGGEFPNECLLTDDLIVRMKNTLRNVYVFRTKNPDKQLYAGEFGCVDFAPEVDRAKWYRTCYQHWTKLRANSTLHAWHEWEHWQPSGMCLEVVKNNLK